ncbi:dinitrogenase iron-molybdenum cofactor biosynthesis protein [Rhodopseudomonas palustris]|uniref:Dinitrogenase iron-molybdenum cofactor biosynthesis protein n=1 Tax=Rhodopseudomonas palustris TaxID=1076 RepID=A0AAX3E734_RHOPL|nr:NifB/NifX family molybdenum-iron cluster-binding protein [Rhodopseudomonas palustris]UYO41912.1 dinitrogenase iron-molybdenum cofactor biosynthesis protein [Rhodopseudomonas palustris]
MGSPSSESEPIKVAIATGNGVGVTEHFGYATDFQIWDVSTSTPRLLETRRNIPGCGADRSATQQRDPLDVSVDLVADCRAVVVAKIGECGVNRLAELNILAFETDDTVDSVVRELAESSLLRERCPA